MTTLEKLSKFAPELEERTEAVQLLIEAKAEIERLEKENAKLKSAMTAIYGICDGPGGDHSFKAARIAREALTLQ